MSDVFLIAEAGVNHNGSVELAHRLIDLAADAGADAVKFQTFDTAAVVAAGTATVDYQVRSTGQSDQHDLLRSLELPRGGWAELAAHCRDRRVEFMSTAFDPASLELLLDVGVQRLKVPSGELTNLPFIRLIAAQGLPVIISTGMGTMDEAVDAAGAADAAPGLTLLHCVSAYPAPLEEANLSAMAKMREATGRPVGWSDHCRGTTAVAMAVALGASVIERHITLDHSMEGPDHAASDDPDEFAGYVDVVRAASAALGDGQKRPSSSEQETRRLARRSWHATRPLSNGSQIEPGDVVALRPATGLPPSVEVVGATLRRDVRAGEVLVEAAVDRDFGRTRG